MAPSVAEVPEKQVAVPVKGSHENNEVKPKVRRIIDEEKDNTANVGVSAISR